MQEQAISRGSGILELQVGALPCLESRAYSKAAIVTLGSSGTCTGVTQGLVRNTNSWVPSITGETPVLRASPASAG